ncbi:phosphate ABC transporter ATP-binding protein [Candidatus Desantisbacteria bacterium]|nr:phosphate ABC transporter ATP-binding protein [Candidatus Desantisbacteria bacterium]
MADRLYVKNLNFCYGSFHALKNINVGFKDKTITALIGPSGCGKSTLLRCLNRMNDLIEGIKITGNIFLDEQDVLSKKTDLISLRKRVGMVFQRPNPFPLTIYENVSFGLEVHGVNNKAQIEHIVEKSLKDAWLWDDLKDKLSHPALSIPLDQQQRLCIARLLAVEPEVILMDEPCSSLDPISTMKIEELMFELKKKYSIVIVTHNMQQAARISQYSGFLLMGEMIEFDETSTIFTNPKNQKTQDYITGRFG